MRKHVIIVEGLIGAGKTTFTRQLALALGPETYVADEPISDLLEAYYADPVRWSFTIQVDQCCNRFSLHGLAQKWAMSGRGHGLLDRSLMGDTCFARLQYKRGLMTKQEFGIYQRLYHRMTEFVLKPTICLRLLAGPEDCQRRIQKRILEDPSRACEKVVALDYLQGLDQEIDALMAALGRQAVKVWDVHWDADFPAQTRQEIAVSLANRINAFEAPDEFDALHGRTVG